MGGKASPDGVQHLAPCPFCHGTDLVYRKDYAEDDPTHAYAIHVFCQDCHTHGRNNYPIGWCETEEMAADAWNDREPPRLKHIGYATEYSVKELMRGASKQIGIKQERSDLSPIPLYAGRAIHADE